MLIDLLSDSSSEQSTGATSTKERTIKMIIVSGSSMPKLLKIFYNETNFNTSSSPEKILVTTHSPPTSSTALTDRYCILCVGAGV